MGDDWVETSARTFRSQITTFISKLDHVVEDPESPRCWRELFNLTRKLVIEGFEPALGERAHAFAVQAPQTMIRHYADHYRGDEAKICAMCNVIFDKIDPRIEVLALGVTNLIGERIVRSQDNRLAYLEAGTLKKMFDYIAERGIHLDGGHDYMPGVTMVLVGMKQGGLTNRLKEINSYRKVKAIWDVEDLKGTLENFKRNAMGYICTPILSERQVNVCNFCGVEESVRKQMKCCAGCRSVFYCSRDHQKKDWGKHKKKCKKRKKRKSKESRV